MQWGMSPQQQLWWEHFLETQAAIRQQTLQRMQQLSPVGQPGWLQFQNSLLHRAQVPALAQGNPQAGTMPFLQQQQADQSSGIDPHLWQLLMGGGGV